MKRKRVWRIVSVALIVVWAVVIFSFSAQPDTESSEISGHVSYRIVKMWNQVFGLKHSGPELEQMAQKIEYPVRKAAHMSEYAVLALLIFQALTAFDRKKNRGCMALGITAAYAATDEFHQLFVPGRAGRVSDVLIDSSGVLLGIAIVSLFMHIKQFLKTKSVYA